MLSIAIPLWLLLSVAGLPALILIGLCARLIRMKRHKEALAAVAPATEPIPAAHVGFDDRIHRQVLNQQIDAVFDILMTLIDTERCKLKALVNHALPVTEASLDAPAAPLPVQVAKAAEASRAEVNASPNPVSISRNIITLAGEGMPAADIARHLGVSVGEVTLALKLKAGRAPHVGRKVMAVA
jgi:hypothetical protein